jgi:acyl dehydratase
VASGPVEVEFSSDVHEGSVDEDAAAAFALATNDPDERYLTGEAVPPMFTAALILGATWQSQRRGREFDMVRGARGSVHGEHDVFYHGAVTTGMRLRWQASIYGAKQTKAGVLLTQRILVTDSEGAPLVEHLWSNFHMGGTIDHDFGDDLVDHTFYEDARSRLFETRVLTIDRDQAFRYAGVSGDHAGHAIDDEIARAEGYPSKILQGMCTFGLCSGALVDVGAPGDSSRLRRFAARFAAPTFPRKDLVINAYDAGWTPEGNRSLAFEAVQNGIAVLKHGRAEFSE